MGRDRPHLCGMATRRSVHDTLEPTWELSWYVVCSTHGSILEARQLPIGAHLKRSFATALQHRIDAGWSVGEFSSHAGVFFCGRGTERRQVSIEPNDPEKPHVERQGWHHPSCPGLAKD
jgi:hypothetical protein